MSDITVILDRKDLVVTVEAGTLRIDRPDSRKPERIPFNMIARVIVKGNPGVSCQVWRSLAEHRIPAVLVPIRGKGEPAYIGAGLSGSVENRMSQYRAVNDRSCCLAICRWLLSLKLTGQEKVIRLIAAGHPDAESLIEPIRKYRADLQKADTQNSLMGHEGAAASLYFKALSRFIPEKWKFSGRNRQPPRDPVNALLSLSYVLAGGEVRSVIQETGLDPAVGFLHASQNGRESFVLDILEPLRPETDWFAIGLLDRILTLRDFTSNKEDGCRLNKTGRKEYYQAWTAWQETGNEAKSLRTVTKEIVSEMMRFF